MVTALAWQDARDLRPCGRRRNARCSNGASGGGRCPSPNREPSERCSTTSSSCSISTGRSRCSERSGPELRIVTVAERKGAVASTPGPETVAHHDFQDCPRLDLVLLPGGIGTLAAARQPRAARLPAQARGRGRDHDVGVLRLGAAREGGPARRPPRHLEQDVLPGRAQPERPRRLGDRARAGSRTAPSRRPPVSPPAPTWRSR